jgi:hypothetical protein
MPEITREYILEKAKKAVETCLEYRRPRLDEIARSEDMYFGKTKPALKGRFNIPVPILEGFVQTLQSKIDDQISIKFKGTRESTLKAAKKVTAAWELESSPGKGNYDGADLDAKSLAIFSGFGVLKLVPSVNPYRQDLIAIDYCDTIFEPYGGQNIETHLFKGQLNIFKTKQELIDGVENSDYDKEDVERLINGTGKDGQKEVQDEREAKMNRYLAMGLNPKNYAYVGSDVFNLTELVINCQGVDYYVLFSYQYNIAIKVKPLKEVFESGLSPFVSWHTERNPVSFLSRSPADGVRPTAEAMRILINQNFDNIQRRNWDMVLYNARKVLNPNDFEFRPNGLIRVKLQDGESMQNAYEKMQTPDTSTITINLLQFLNSFIGEKTGVTPTTQGTPETDVLGIQNNIIQQTADRFGLLNKFYKQAHVDIAKRYKANLAEFMPTNFMVTYLGVTGKQDEELTRKEVREDFGIEVISANAEAQNNEATNQKQQNALVLIMKDPLLRAQVGSKWLLEEILRTGAYTEDEIKNAENKDDRADAVLLSEAAQSIEAIVQGESPKVNRSATTAFIRKILNYAMEESDTLDDDVYAKLITYAIQHLPIVEQNAQLFMQVQSPIQQPQEQEVNQEPQVPQNAGIAQ